MSRTSRNPFLWLALLLAAMLCLGGRAMASTATITVSGAEQQLSGGWDANSITISFNGFTETVSYGQFTSPAAIASGIGAMFSNDYLPSGLYAHAVGNVVTFQLRGAAAFGALQVDGPTNSFTLSSSGFASATQQPQTDASGTVI